MKANLKWVLVAVVIWMICIGVVCTEEASSPTVSVDPPEVRDLEPGKSFTVNITVTGIVIDETIGHKCYGLFGWSINLTFNPDVLNVTSVTEGSFLQDAYETIFLPVRMNNTAGYVITGAMFMPPFPDKGASGNGVLATIHFNVKGRGIADLHFQTSKINTVIAGNNVAIEHTANDGKFANATQFTLPYEIIVVIVVVVAIGAGAALFFYRRRRAVEEDYIDS